MASTEAKKITKSVCNINREWKYLQRDPLCQTDSDKDCIIDEIKRIYTTEYEIYMSVEDNNAWFI